MGNWVFGASAKEFDRFREYGGEFDFLEIDLEKAVKESIRSMDDVIARALEYKYKIYSMHLSYKPPKDGSVDGIGISISELELLFNAGLAKELGVEMFVTHTDYPKNPEELESQLRRLGDAAEKHSVIVAVENVGDRKNKTNGYMAPRNPRELAGVLAKIENPHLGLCLDTGHALGNAGLTDSLLWDDDVIQWLKHMHYNDNVLRGDEHIALSSSTNEKFIAAVEYLMQASVHNGVAILEHRKLEEAIQSRDFIQTHAYAYIIPTPLG